MERPRSLFLWPQLSLRGLMGIVFVFAVYNAFFALLSDIVAFEAAGMGHARQGTLAGSVVLNVLVSIPVVLVSLARWATDRVRHRQPERQPSRPKISGLRESMRVGLAGTFVDIGLLLLLAKRLSSWIGPADFLCIASVLGCHTVILVSLVLIISVGRFVRWATQHGTFVG